MDLEKYMNVAIMMMCLGIGSMLKIWKRNIDKRYLPTICFICGVLISFMINGIHIESFNIGWVSGLASTGMHQIVKQITEKQKD